MAVLLEDHLPVVKYNGLNTDKAVVLGSTLAVTGAQTFTGNTTFSGDAAVTGALAVTGASTLTGAVNYKMQVTDTGGAYATPIALTEAQSGRVILVDDAAGLAFTLPAIAAAQIGTTYRFLVTVAVTSNLFSVTAATADLLNGGIWLADFDTANTGAYFKADGSDDLIFSCNGTTTGGKIGTDVTFIATTAAQWVVTGHVFGDGTLATPFS